MRRKIFFSILIAMLVFSFTTSASSEAQIWTEDEQGNWRTDFWPDENVYIRGSGFDPNAQIDISITRPDNVVENYSTSSDENGCFLYIYTLDGIEGTYCVTATDGINSADTTFDDSKIRFYKDPACTIREEVFYQGETVYAKATDLKSNKYYKLVWFNPLGDNVKEIVYENGANSRTDNYLLPPGAPIGTWEVKLFEGTSSSGPWSSKPKKARFYVWHDIAPIADSWVELKYPDKNKGSDKKIHVRVDWDEGKGEVTNLRRSYLKFDLSGLPPGVMITSAKLHLYKTTTDDDIPSVYRTTDNWIENEITWNNQPGPENLENDNGTASGKWVEWDITSYAASEFEGDKVLSVVLKFNPENSDQHADFISREYKWNQRPWLEISYTVTPPSAPTPYLPADGTVTNDNTVYFEWSNIADAENYDLFVDNDPDFSSPEVSITITDNNYTSPALPDDNYSWRVRARDAANNVSDNSATRTFLIDTVPPSAPTPYLPADGTVTNDNTVYFEWSNIADAENYDLFVDNDPDFSSPEVSITITDNNYTSPALPDDNYSWRVRAVDSAGNVSAWSSTWTFLIKTVVREVEVSISPIFDNGLLKDVIITNNGNIVDSYGLTAEDNVGWSSMLAENLVENVMPGENRMTTLSLAIPSGTKSGTVGGITVTATSQESPEVSGSGSAQVTAVSAVDVSISPKENWGRQGQTLIYVATIWNIGNTVDNYYVTKTDELGWLLGGSFLWLYDVAPGSFVSANLEVTIPENMGLSTKDVITVTATSQIDNTVSDNDNCIAFGPNLAGGSWNLISFWKVSENDTPDNIFAGLTYYIWEWDNIQQKYVSPPSDKLVELGKGYWIYVGESTSAKTSGAPVENWTIGLTAGWNLVGFPVTSENTTSDKLFAGVTYYIWGWDAIQQKYFSPPSDQPVKTAMDPADQSGIGVGYWVWVEKEMTVTVPL